MKKQKGMTLIEVMVAMLVLSIAMIGGISFFTSAYRINYSYMESANRIDHALRYVEKLKVQRRSYPTYGAFPNKGGSGYTLFYVGSDASDIYAPDVYSYEDYPGSGAINLALKLTFSTEAITPNYYYAFAQDAIDNNGNFVEPTFLSDYLLTQYSVKRTLLSYPSGGLTTKLTFQMFSSDSYDASLVFYFANWADYLRQQYKNTDFMTGSFFGYTEVIKPSRGIYANSHNNYKSARANYPNAEYELNRPLYKNTAFEVDENIDISESGSELWQDYIYRGYNTGSPIASGAEGEMGKYGEFYINADNHISHQVYETNVSTWFTSLSEKTRDSDGDSYLLPPDGVYVKAKIQKGQATGKERLHKVRRWYGYKQVDDAEAYKYTAKYPVQFGIPSVNNHRMTKYRNSTYISIYSVENITKVNEILSDVINNATTLSDRIEKIEDAATANGYKVIKIPFISLYANNTLSTLCEDLD